LNIIMASLSYDEKVWIDADRKLEGICDDIIMAGRGGSNVLVVAHFESTLSLVAAKLRDRAIHHHTFFPGDNADLCKSAGTTKVWIALAQYFQSRNLSTGARPENAWLSVLVAEHHPIDRKDDALLEGVGELPCQRAVVFHTALTDALLAHFGGERLRGLLNQLGHDETTYLSHPLVSAAIRRAQKKIGKQVHQEMRTLSAEDWFKYNLRDSG
jgi:preprotein translocase subunit SecA